MWVIAVLPLGKAAAHKEFSYFSAKEHPEGTIVRIPARSKESFGLVMRCTPLQDLKQDLRTAKFSLQKVSGAGNRILTRPFLRSVFEMAQWHACSAGAVVNDLVPQAVLEAAVKMPAQQFDTAPLSAHAHSAEAIVASRQERLFSYGSMARDLLASDKSLLIITPTIAEAVRIADMLKSTDLPIAELHSGLSKKDMRSNWQHIAQSRTPLIVAGTALALSAPRRDFGVIILERAGARGFVREERPFLHIRTCAQMLAQTLGIRLLVGSPAPLIDYGSHGHASKTREADVSIIDMRPPKDKSAEGFRTFSPESLAFIERSLASHSRLLLLCARRGLAPQTVCQDCGDTIRCEQCLSAMTLVETSGHRLFRCPYCNSTRSTMARCRTCGGWRLKPLGIGLETVAKETARLFPDAPIYLMDEKVFLKHSAAQRTAEEFQRSGGICIGTEGALPYLALADDSIVASVDSFFFTPEYSASERAFQLLSELRGLTENRLLVQTRVPKHPVLAGLSDAKTFLKQEDELRKQFSYPPHAHLIRLTLSGPRAGAERDFLLKSLAAFKLQAFSGKPARAKNTRGRRREHILLRLSRERWPDKELLGLLRQLPPSVEIRVDPQAIFGD